MSATKAALAAAALLWGGVAAHALTAPSLPVPAAGNASDNPISLPDPVAGFVLSDHLSALEAGTPFAVSSTTPFGTVSFAAHASFPAPQLLPGGLIGRDVPIGNFAFLDRIAKDTTLAFGYSADATERFDITDVRSNPAYAGIFSSLSGFESGLGIGEFHSGASLGLGDGVSLDLGEQLFDTSGSLDPAYPFAPASNLAQRADTSYAGVGWKFASWGGVGLTASHARNAAFGGLPASGLSLAKSATNALGASGQIAFRGGWVTSFSYSEGVTQLDLRPAAPASGSLHDASYGFAIAKHGLFGDDAVGLAVSRPLYSGDNTIDLGGTASADPFDGFISSQTRPILSGSAARTDVELGYVTTFMDGALALQANAGYQMNAAGEPGNNSVAVLSRAKINF